MPYPNYGVDNKKGCVHITSEYRTWARSVNSLKAWFTRATQMQMQEQTTFIRQTQTQGRQDTQGQSRTVKFFPRWRSKVKLGLSKSTFRGFPI